MYFKVHCFQQIQQQKKLDIFGWLRRKNSTIYNFQTSGIPFKKKEQEKENGKSVATATQSFSTVQFLLFMLIERSLLYCKLGPNTIHMVVHIYKRFWGPRIFHILHIFRIVVCCCLLHMTLTSYWTIDFEQHDKLRHTWAHIYTTHIIFM